MIRLEILSLVPTSFDQCAHCETLYGQAGVGERVHKVKYTGWDKEVLGNLLRDASNG